MIEIDGVTVGIISNLLTMIGINGTKMLLETSTDTSEAAFEAKNKHNEIQDLGETPSFLTHQRFYYRLELAKAKWQWLKLATYYHPVAGKTSRLPADWDPKSIGGHFTTADFAGRDLPHESYMGEYLPSDIRLQVLHNQISLVSTLNNSIEAIESALQLSIESHQIEKLPFNYPETRPAWISFMLAVKQKKFAQLPNLNSYCGFKNLWSVIDTPAQGIRERGSDQSNSNLFAYAALMELSWYLSRIDSEIRGIYDQNILKADKNKLPHQEALRKVAVHLLKTLWKSGIFETSNKK